MVLPRILEPALKRAAGAYPVAVDEAQRDPAPSPLLEGGARNAGTDGTQLPAGALREWLSVLKTSFLVFLLLGIRTTEQLRSHSSRGALFENHVVSEAAKAYWNHRRTPPIYFWRDQTGHEIDLLIEEGTTLFPVEIKSGATVAGDM